MLSVIVCLADSSQQMLETRAGAIFDIFDFDGTAQINQDETVSFSFNSILNLTSLCRRFY
jgi:hypothetical protein